MNKGEKYFIKEIDGRQVLEPKYMRVEPIKSLSTKLPRSDRKKLESTQKFFLDKYNLKMSDAHAIRLAVHCFDKSLLERGGEALYWQTKAPQFFHFDENHQP
jgi:hypothetical protein